MKRDERLTRRVGGLFRTVGLQGFNKVQKVAPYTFVTVMR